MCVQWLRVCVIALVVAWVTLGDCVLIGAGLAPAHDWPARLEQLYVLSTVGIAIPFWVIVQSALLGAQLLRRWQTYVGLVVAILGSMPVCVGLHCVGGGLSGVAPGVSVHIRAVLVGAAMVSKGAVWWYWWTRMARPLLHQQTP